MQDFAAKLAIVLKALALSRGRLAADLRVDKSVVSRWMNGTYAPAGENLSALTRLVAARVPGFTGLDWDRDIASLAALFGHGGIAAPAAMPSNALLLPHLDSVRERTARHGAGLEGHWHGWRQTFLRPDRFARDAVRIRRDGDFLTVEVVNDGTHWQGLLLLGSGKASMVLSLPHGDTPGFGLFYTIEGSRAQHLDGVVCMATLLASRAIGAFPYVMQRYGTILPERDADDCFFTTRIAAAGVVGSDEVPDEIRARLLRDPGGDWPLRLTGEGSLVRSTTPAESEAADAVAAAAMAQFG